MEEKKYMFYILAMNTIFFVVVHRILTGTCEDERHKNRNKQQTKYCKRCRTAQLLHAHTINSIFAVAACVRMERTHGRCAALIQIKQSSRNLIWLFLLRWQCLRQLQLDLRALRNAHVLALCEKKILTNAPLVLSQIYSFALMDLD